MVAAASSEALILTGDMLLAQLCFFAVFCNLTCENPTEVHAEYYHSKLFYPEVASNQVPANRSITRIFPKVFAYNFLLALCLVHKKAIYS